MSFVYPYNLGLSSSSSLLHLFLRSFLTSNQPPEPCIANMSKPQVLICGTIVHAHDELKNDLGSIAEILVSCHSSQLTRLTRMAIRLTLFHCNSTSIHPHEPNSSKLALPAASMPTSSPFTDTTIPWTRWVFSTLSSSMRSLLRSSRFVTTVLDTIRSMSMLPRPRESPFHTHLLL